MNKFFMIFIGFFLVGTNLLSAQQSDKKMGGTIEAEIDGKLVYLPQLNTEIIADVNGDIASVEITQTFANPHDVPMNARYLFPMNKDAAVYQMKMVIGDEITHAIIKRKEDAKRTFEQAKREGKTASLLSQHRPNMFTQNIANLMPGEPVLIRIKYTQVVSKIDGNYELVMPLVVGPRYQPEKAGKAPAIIDDGQRIPLESASTSSYGRWELEQLPDYAPVIGLTLPDEIAQDRVSIKVNLISDIPVQYVNSDTHEIQVSGPVNGRRVNLKRGRTIDNRDFVLKYQLAGAVTNSGFLSTMDEEGEGYFSLLIEPPKAPADDQISKREMVFVLDSSGSMNGQPLEASKTFMRHALNNLRSGDYFRIISFNNTASEYSNSPQLATPENIKNGLAFVEGLQARGGTEIANSISQAFRVPPKDGNIRLVTFLTDGYIGNEAQILEQISASIGDARIFAFGVGTSVNRYLLNEMGRKGRGFARYIDPTESMNDAAISLAARLNAPVLTDISIDFGNMEVSQVTPQIIPDLFAGDSIRIQGKYKSKGKHEIRINGKSRGNKASLPLRVNLANDKVDNLESIPIIWARSQIAERMRHITTAGRFRSTEKSETQLKEEIVKLGLTHSLVTQWTSFVAVSNKIRNLIPEENVEGNVPLPMPKGVTEQAYGNTRPQRNVIIRRGGNADTITVVGSRIKGRTALDSNIPADVIMAAELTETPSLNLQDVAAPKPVAAPFSGGAAPEPGAIGGLAVLGLMSFLLFRRKRKD